LFLRYVSVETFPLTVIFVYDLKTCGFDLSFNRVCVALMAISHCTLISTVISFSFNTVCQLRMDSS